jgi:hypothetical protein
MPEYWFNEDDELDVIRMTDEQVIDSLRFLLETVSEKGGYSRKMQYWAEEVLCSLWLRGLIYEYEEE